MGLVAFAALWNACGFTVGGSPLPPAREFIACNISRSKQRRVSCDGSLRHREGVGKREADEVSPLVTSKPSW
jgi:hypothetical protein